MSGKLTLKNRREVADDIFGFGEAPRGWPWPHGVDFGYGAAAPVLGGWIRQQDLTRYKIQPLFRLDEWIRDPASRAALAHGGQ